LDDNLLACSDQHIKDVFAMLKRQQYGQPIFTGGIEAAILKDWHCKLLYEVKPKSLFFAHDTPDDLEPLIEARVKLKRAGFTTANHTLRCYVLIGYPKDTFEAAEQRLVQTVNAGFLPMAMLYRDKQGHVEKEWQKFQRKWARPSIVGSIIKEEAV